MSNFFARLGLGLKKSSDKISGGLSGIFTKKKVDAQTLEELEELLISADLGVKASTGIINGFAQRRLDKDISLPEIKEELAADIETILTPCQQPLIISPQNKPFVILMVGVNGAGKTTTALGILRLVPEPGKVTARLKKESKQISYIAADTFRAAAVEQLEIWGQRNKVRIFKGAPDCDSAGLCYDGLQQAAKAGDDIVFIDTAGRLQNKSDLMAELQKIIRVIKKVMPDAPHAVLLTIDATAGQNALDQVKTFKSMVEVTGLVVTKLDGSAKGGILAAIAAETAVPVHYVGVGGTIDDLDEFNARDFARNLLEIK